MKEQGADAPLIEIFLAAISERKRSTLRSSLRAKPAGVARRCAVSDSPTEKPPTCGSNRQRRMSSSGPTAARPSSFRASPKAGVCRSARSCGSENPASPRNHIHAGGSAALSASLAIRTTSALSRNRSSGSFAMPSSMRTQSPRSRRTPCARGPRPRARSPWPSRPRQNRLEFASRGGTARAKPSARRSHCRAGIVRPGLGLARRTEGAPSLNSASGKFKFPVGPEESGR